MGRDHAQSSKQFDYDFASRARVETRFEEEAQPLVDLRICFDIGGFWIAWFSCRRVVEMKTRESNLSVTHDAASHSAYWTIQEAEEVDASQAQTIDRVP